MYPFHVETNNQTPLIQLSDGRFQLIKQGTLGPVMVGFKYILVENQVALELRKLKIDRVTFKPAVVWDRKSNTEETGYTQMEVNHHFNSENKVDLDLDGCQFLLMDNLYLFVSPELKEKIEKSSLKWRFSKGFGNFG